MLWVHGDLRQRQQEQRECLMLVGTGCRLEGSQGTWRKLEQVSLSMEIDAGQGLQPMEYYEWTRTMQSAGDIGWEQGLRLGVQLTVVQQQGQ